MPTLSQPVFTALMVIATAMIQLAMQIVLHRVTPPRAWSAVSASTQRLAVTIAAVTVLMIGHLCQVVVWAVRYWYWGELGGFVNSFYFSLASFTTVGASDLTLSSTHRMVGAIESALGMLMFGWSTALLVALIQRVDRLHQPGSQPDQLPRRSRRRTSCVHIERIGHKRPCKDCRRVSNFVANCQ